jgi:type II secretory pathway pseudopilin PulG
MKFSKNGISLIVLVITIIVIIILAGAVILSLASNNPISQASKSTFLSDLGNFKTELDLYKSKQYLDNLGSYDPELLQANGSSITYNGVTDDTKSIEDIITTLDGNAKYAGKFEIINGSLLFLGENATEQEWANELGIATDHIDYVGNIYTFTNASATYAVGPTQSQIDTAYAETTLEGLVTSSNGIQLWTVPYTGAYNILVKGAKGGNGNNGGSATESGNGAEMQGDFNLTKGQVLKILVGQMGSNSSTIDTGGGGGGGTFIVLDDNTPLIIAGGGGAGGDNGPVGSGGTTSTTGLTGGNSGGAGGTNGSGGTGYSTAGGGGGLLTDGTDATYGGKAFVNGGAGAVGIYGIGGFGGGGGTSCEDTDNGTGGGGYSGGGAGASNAGGGGGGSYNAGTNQINTSSSNVGQGTAIITVIQ